MRNMTTPRKPAVGSLRAVRVLTTLLSIACSVLWAAAASAADATEQAVLAAHEKRRNATLAGDAAAVGSMMTDDLTFTHANAAVETKAEFLDALKTGRYQYKSLTDEERGVRVHGDTGIVSGTCRIVVTAGRTSTSVCASPSCGEGGWSLADASLARDQCALANW